MSNPIWYIEVNSRAVGPYSIEELEQDLRLTPDTRVWKEGFPQWKMIRDVPELKILFKDKEKQKKKPLNLEEDPQFKLSDQLVMEMGEQPPYFWILVILVTLIYIFIHFYTNAS